LQQAFFFNAWPKPPLSIEPLFSGKDPVEKFSKQNSITTNLILDDPRRNNLFRFINLSDFAVHPDQHFQTHNRKVCSQNQVFSEFLIFEAMSSFLSVTHR